MTSFPVSSATSHRRLSRPARSPSPPRGEGIPATLYIPADLPEPSGLLVYFHGGGFSVGSRFSHDPIARYLASHAGGRVLSVEYRRAPEHQFPAPVNDAFAAFDYAHDHARDLGADPARIAVGGDSAGGNLAAVTTQQAVRRGGTSSVVPAVDLSRDRSEYPTAVARPVRRRFDLHRTQSPVGDGQLRTSGNRSGRSATVTTAWRRRLLTARLHRQRRFRSRPRRR